jgi:hypothetical protein
VALALLPIALGHALAIGIALVLLSFVERFLPATALKWTVAGIIFAVGAYRLVRAGHPRGSGMRVGGRDLFLWSFLMASAHGAGLMLIPVLLSHPTVTMNHTMAEPMSKNIAPLSTEVLLSSVFIHTAAMLIVAAVIALIFFELYDRVGLKILRHAWLNFDLLWAIALLIASVAVLFM